LNKILKVKNSLTPSDGQKVYINKLCTLHNAILCAKTGEGKTVSSLYAFAWLKYHGVVDNMIVLMPLSAYTKEVWQKDLVQFFNLTYITLDELIKKYKITKDIMGRFDVILCKHTHVKQQQTTLKMLTSLTRTIVCIDEVTTFKNPKAQIYKMCTPVMKSPLRRWFLTATPLTKNLEDTYYITKLLDPQIFGTKELFTNMYCTTYVQNVRQNIAGQSFMRGVTLIDGIKDKAVFDAKLETFLIRGKNIVTAQFHYVNYENNDQEKLIYTKVANGISMGEEAQGEEEDFLAWVLSGKVEKKEIDSTRMKSIEKHSSRFIYLQDAADGLISLEGVRGYDPKNPRLGPKLEKLYKLVSTCVEQKNSILIYFEYYSALRAAQKILSNLDCVLLESSGTNVLDSKVLTEEKCKRKSHVVLCTRAASESVSYYWLNHVCFFHVPVAPNIFTQFVGRITRLNSKHADNLHCWIFQSNNIDKYRFMIMSHKAYQLELVSGPEENIPETHKAFMSSRRKLEMMKHVLLWNNESMKI
jgi:Cdc6-like AAA superfamily ATPase